MIITKSISRFARNTVTLLKTVRELKTLGIDIFFEEQGIHTLSGEGELMLSLLASVAQEESLSVSENQKWRVRRNFENCLPWNCTMLGYRQKNQHPVIMADEAEIVKRIFDDYLAGLGALAISKKLNEEGIPSRCGGKWRPGNLQRILKNITYNGRLLLQKTYRENHLTKRTVKNKGERPLYLVEESHEAIIDDTTFEAVQAERTRRAEKFAGKHGGRDCKKQTYPFTGLMVCDDCGKHYRRKTITTGIVWICGTYNTLGKSACPTSKQIPETTLMKEASAVLGLPSFDPEVFKERIDHIDVPAPNHLLFVFKGGKTVERVWKDRSRAESWTDEMKDAARQKTFRRSEWQN